MLHAEVAYTVMGVQHFGRNTRSGAVIRNVLKPRTKSCSSFISAAVNRNTLEGPKEQDNQRRPIGPPLP
ncbi:hypothetical protein AGOR_G00231160 [Albula goreensis]|uniref:Uncharacterized protein n=1 Tax=Albula goreensis TaxID=1534307 RepID=A0A8T3CHA0_9TELE|nr:hypothetical protein AGOR_G00231160 [Albula goreensis]